MEDIIKSGLLGLVLVGALVLASVTSQGEVSNSNYEISKVEEVSILDDNYKPEEVKVTSKEDIHIPM